MHLPGDNELNLCTELFSRNIYTFYTLPQCLRNKTSSQQEEKNLSILQCHIMAADDLVTRNQDINSHGIDIVWTEYTCIVCLEQISNQGRGAVSDLSLISDLSQKFKHDLWRLKSKFKLSQKQHLTPADALATDGSWSSIDTIFTWLHLFNITVFHVRYDHFITHILHNTTDCRQKFVPWNESLYWVSPFCLHCINSSPPSATCMRQWMESALVQIMDCRLFGAKPLSKPSWVIVNWTLRNKPVKF